MRFNLATSANPRMLQALEATLDRARQRLKSGEPPR
jgi:hypothetical protein